MKRESGINVVEIRIINFLNGAFFEPHRYIEKYKRNFYVPYVTMWRLFSWEAISKKIVKFDPNLSLMKQHRMNSHSLIT
jgi:hypothetical protein